jgi:hypothetical protein
MINAVLPRNAVYLIIFENMAELGSYVVGSRKLA